MVDTEALVAAMVTDITALNSGTERIANPTPEEALDRLPTAGPLMREAQEAWRAEGKGEFYIARKLIGIHVKAARQVKKAVA